MKNRLLFGAAALLVLLFSVVMYRTEDGTDTVRVHQHLSSPQEQTGETETFATHLPIVEIDTQGQAVPGSAMTENGKFIGYEMSATGEKTIDVSLTLKDGGQGNNTREDTAQVDTRAQIRYRGNSSRLFDKKSYAVRLVDENGEGAPQPMAGMAAHDEWVLNGPFLDRTMIRNYLCLNVAGEIMEYAPNVRYCELFVNGAYQGVYLLMESIAMGDGRIRLTKPEDGKDMTSWIVRWDRSGKGNQELDNFTYYTYKSDVSSLDVRYPGRNKITPGRMAYIEKEISRVEKTLYSYDLSDGQKGYAQYLDVRAFAQYFVINEFFRNVDAGRFSTFYYKDVRGKIKPCVWDFNNGCDNYIDYDWDEAGFTMQNAPWFGALLKDETFVDAVVSEYRRLRGSVLSEASLLEYIDQTRAYLGGAVDRNYAVWGYAFDLDYAIETDDGHNYLSPVERNVTSYDGAIGQLKDFIVRRGNWLDAHIDTLYQYCQDSKNANTLVR